MDKRLVAALLALVPLAACVQTNTVMLNPSGPRYAPVAEQEVRVYLRESDVPAECQQLALINATGGSTWTNESQMVRAMQRKAGEAGANAVVLGEIREPSAGTKIAGAIFGVDPSRKGKVVALRCEAAAPAAAPTAATPTS